MAVVGFRPLKASGPAQAAVVLTDDDVLAARCRRFRDEHPDHRLSELHATLALVELGRLAGTLDGRGRSALRHAEALAGYPLAVGVEAPDGTRSAWASFLVRVPAWARAATHESLGRAGVEARRVPLLLHRHPFFGRSAAVLPAELPGTERFAAETLLLATAEDDDALRSRGDRVASNLTTAVLDRPRVAVAG
jgi:dTDP-4-amino-4,6-dideoxygalactose transaminase